MEDLVLRRKREQLEDQLLKDEYNYDLWFDYIRLEEQANQVDLEKVREVYRRAVFFKPPVLEK